MSALVQSLRVEHALGSLLALLVLIATAACGASVVEVEDSGAKEPPDDEPLDDYPLDRSDLRAQLDPSLVNVESERGPVVAGPKAPLSPEQHQASQRGVRYVVASGEQEMLGSDPVDEILARVKNRPIPARAAPQPREVHTDQSLVGLRHYGSVSWLDSASESDEMGVTGQALVWDADTRFAATNVLAWPWRTNVKLFPNWPTVGVRGCSGQLIGEKYVLTAGHCVYQSEKGGWALSIKVVPALFGTYMPFGDANTEYINSVSGWLDDENNDYDFALITLDRRVGIATGYTPLCTLSDDDWDARGFYTRGYPFDWGDGQTLVGAYGQIEAMDSTMLYHFADTEGGMSGAGMNPTGIFGGNSNCAVHTGSGWFFDGWRGQTYNAATRINNSRFNQINGWMSQNNTGLFEEGGGLLWLGTGGITDHPVTVTTSKNGRYYDAFVRGTNGEVYHKARTATANIPTSGWTPIGGNSLGSPAAVSRAPGVLDVFIRDPRQPNPGIYTKAWNGSAWVPSQTGWWSIGGSNVVSDPTAVSWSSNRLDVFGRGSANDVLHAWWAGSSWSGWESLGGNVTGTVSVVSRGSDWLDLFVRGTDGAIWTKAWTGSSWWPSPTGWSSLGGNFPGPPVAVVTSPNQIDLFNRGWDNAAWTLRWQSCCGWGTWTSLGGNITSQVAAVSRSTGLIDIFIRSAGGGIFTKAWTGTSWWPSQTDWAWLGGNLAFDVSVTSSGPNRLDLLARMPSDIGYKYWEGVWVP